MRGAYLKNGNGTLSSEDAHRGAATSRHLVICLHPYGTCNLHARPVNLVAGLNQYLNSAADRIIELDRGQEYEVIFVLVAGAMEDSDGINEAVSVAEELQGMLARRDAPGIMILADKTPSSTPGIIGTGYGRTLDEYKKLRRPVDLLMISDSVRKLKTAYLAQQICGEHEELRCWVEGFNRPGDWWLINNQVTQFVETLGYMIVPSMVRRVVEATHRRQTGS